MSDGERTICNAKGRYMHAMQNGYRVDDAEWQPCRLVLTNHRLALISDSRYTITLSDLEDVGGRFDVNQAAAQVTDYTKLQRRDDVVLVAATDQESFQTDFYRACLSDAVVLVNHPAVEGGVVQDADWQRSRIKVTDDSVDFVLEDGRYVEVRRDDIGRMAHVEKRAAGERREIVEFEHSQDGVSVETHVAPSAFERMVIDEVIEKGVEQSRADVELNPVEEQVVMALHSGVSPFKLPEFVGTDVEEVEEIFDRLIDLDVIEVVRERTEVSMTARARKLVDTNQE
jgi:helix-turn-helix protein